MKKKFLKRVTIIFGTRPEAIKLATVIKKFKEVEFLDIRIVLTGQHKEMVEQVNTLFNINYDKNLEVMSHGQNLNDLTKNILNGVREELINFKSDLVIVQGDTTTAFASALASFYERVPVAHIEAGLRTDSLFNPYPEELNRRLISQLSTLHFAPTEKSAKNLASNNIKENVFVTGNTVIDALLYVKDEANPKQSINVNWKNRVLLTSVHRRENWGENLEDIALGLKKIIELYPDLYLVLPMHKNLKVREPLKRIMGNSERIILCESFDYLEMVGAIKNCHLLITDSGGLQEEAPTFGKPVLVLRKNTERIEGIEAGVSKLIGTNQNDIVREVSLMLNSKDEYYSMSKTLNPYGDGTASDKIKNICLDFLKIKN